MSSCISSNYSIIQSKAQPPISCWNMIKVHPQLIFGCRKSILDKISFSLPANWQCIIQVRTFIPISIPKIWTYTVLKIGTNSNQQLGRWRMKEREGDLARNRSWGRPRQTNTERWGVLRRNSECLQNPTELWESPLCNPRLSQSLHFDTEIIKGDGFTTHSGSTHSSKQQQQQIT